MRGGGGQRQTYCETTTRSQFVSSSQLGSRRWPKKSKVELNNIERTVPDQVNHVSNSQYLELTVDSGAAENVKPKYMAPGRLHRVSRAIFLILELRSNIAL